MKQVILTINNTLPLTSDIYSLTLSGDVSAVSAPGQFVDIEIPGLYLRRPVSVSMKREERDGSYIDLIIKEAGEGTKRLSTLPQGTMLDTLTDLGRGFDLSRAGDKPLIVAGGVGTAPFIWLLNELLARGAHPTAVLGFGRKEEAAALCALIPAGVNILISTLDGTLGIRGTVADALSSAGNYSYYYVSGPTPMMKAVHRVLRGPGEYSLEERMGCGYGVCMGCSVGTIDGPKRICHDGPVFREDELIWDD